ncbi:MAG: hypothetical protein JO327_02825, partial [Nitrososphaeraceae archaeon]|nr:hypothetical protein [Nitrososphaeraceae archaeon]MBV9667044.1 hypothetical protein [Nitrososphaeraceae archaeon]
MQRLLKEKKAFSFDWKKSFFALVISIIADTLDLVGEPILGIPLIGDIPNAFVTGLLFVITRNKRSAAINLIKFIPVIGDFIPTYTISTLMWIHKEARKSKSTEYI